jgi:hypothetical protein
MLGQASSAAGLEIYKSFRVCESGRSQDGQMLKLRLSGIHDYSVLEGHQRIGRIRFAGERLPPIWLWNVVIHLTGGLPMGSSKDLNTAKAEFKTAWKALKSRTPPEDFVAAYKAMNIRDDG